jgi:hypothetical protein
LNFPRQYRPPPSPKKNKKKQKQKQKQKQTNKIKATTKRGEKTNNYLFNHLSHILLIFDHV